MTGNEPVNTPSLAFPRAGRQRFGAALVLVLPLLLAACVSNERLSADGSGSDADNGDIFGQQADSGPNDPFENVNRAIFGFNQQVDRFVIEPISVAYVELTPEPLRDSIANALHNLGLPLSAIHSVLQGKFDEAGHTAERFVANSATLWLGDLFADMPYPDEDAGQTLAVAGVGSGPYLVLPLLGPSSVRDAFGRLVDTIIDPAGIVIGPTGGLVRAGVDGVDTRARIGPTLDELEETSLDFYATLRSLYNQNRAAQIRDGEVDPLFSAAPTVVVDLSADFGAAAAAADFAAPSDAAAASSAIVVPATARPVIAAEALPIPTATLVGEQADVDGAAQPTRVGELDETAAPGQRSSTIPEMKKLGIDVDLLNAPDGRR